MNARAIVLALILLVLIVVAYYIVSNHEDERSSVEITGIGDNMFPDLKPEDIENVMRVYRTYLSLDAPISKDDETSYIDMLEEKDAVTAEENLFQHSLEEEIEYLLEDLEPREREIIRLRFGFDGDPMTLEDIGQKIGLSRERIRQIEKKVIRRFRARAKNKTLLDYLR